MKPTQNKIMLSIFDKSINRTTDIPIVFWYWTAIVIHPFIILIRLLNSSRSTKDPTLG